MENIPLYDPLRREPSPLDVIFKPTSVAVIGAKDDPGSVGRTVVSNLLASFEGKIYPVNPKRQEVLGLKCYPSVEAIGEPVDLAVIATPAATVLNVVKSCARAKVGGLIVLSAGFKELGEEGLKLEQELVEAARAAKMPLIGPNCLGVANPLFGLNATFAKGEPFSGDIAFISQSGAMCTAVLDWSLQEGVGFSSFVSIGSMADVGWGDLIRYFGRDGKTKSVLLYMETVGEARRFLSAAREVALGKPIIVIKGGKTEESARACASHTGSLAGSDRVFNAALKRCGVMRVDTIGELFGLAQALAFQPRPKGPNLSIVTNAGGPSVLATDALVLEGGRVADLSEETMETLNALLPDAWSHANPVDILGDAKRGRYVEVVDLLMNDEDNNGVLVILTPQDMTDPLGTATDLRHLSKSDKPLLTSWMGGGAVESSRHLLSQSKIPNYPYPDEAAKIFSKMWRYQENLNLLYETPTANALEQHPERLLEAKERGEELINRVLAEGRTLLDEWESKELLALWGIPVVITKPAKTPEEAVKRAEEIGYPSCVKLLSHTITHKTDVGGVKLNLNDAEEVYDAFMQIQNSVPAEDFLGVTVQKMVKLKGYELIMGSSHDVQFGPILLFGTGGSLVEVFKDTSLSLPPLNSTLAEMMLKETKIYTALEGFRGEKRVDLPQLSEMMVRFSDMILAHPRIKESDINPLIVSHEGITALDARVVLFSEEEPLIQSAIRPYPYHYSWKKRLKNGEDVQIRPIRPEDEPALVAYHQKLSEESIKQRFLEPVSLEKRVSHERLIGICCNDYDREWALVVEKDEEIIGVARITRLLDEKKARLKMMVLDSYQGQGLGRLLLEKLIFVAKSEGVKEIDAIALAENRAMAKLAKDLGFERNEREGDLVTYHLSC